MKLRELHDWALTPREARSLQEALRGQVRLERSPGLGGIRRVAGVDNSYVRDGETTTAFASVVVLSFPELEVVEVRHAALPISFPYVPGLLSFREAPAILAACRAVESEPDVVLFDGHGLAHPCRLGLAAHLGLFLDRPAIGVAKSRLVGEHEEPVREFGARQPLFDRGDMVGMVVRTRPSSKPVFVSPGHRMSLEAAVEIVLACCRPNRRLPEPIRLAHHAVTEYSRPYRERARRPPLLP